jgi:murein DD-endopeptidase MepM/ murein hydrolase activator NlpD
LAGGIARYGAHLWVLALSILLGGLVPVGLHRLPPDASATGQADASLLRAGAHLDGMLKPYTSAARAEQLRPVTTYTVQPADTIESIAARAGLRVETVLQVNHLMSGDQLVLGEVLFLPPIDGSMVPVEPGQSLAQIASALRLDPALIRVLNNLPPTAPLPPEIFVPDVSTTELPQRVTLAAPTDTRHHLVRFAWPTQGVITTFFLPWHPGLDIANAYGTPEVAADGGRVVFAGWGSYGIYVQIDHGNGFTTVYGHMERVVVAVGQVIQPGQLLGYMGATGRATGPHLHFEIRYHDVPQNPLDYLP